jgi:hypothetical protein
LIRRLHVSGLVKFRRRRPKRIVELFVVGKKGRQSAVDLWCSIPNCLGRDPDEVLLGSGGSFGLLELDQGPPLYVGEADIDVAFYALENVPELHEYFGLSSLRGRNLLTPTVEGVKVLDEEMIYPVFVGIPMGFSWAVLLASRS